MTKTIRQTLLTFLLVALGFALTPATAQAEFLDFTVDETTVPGTGLSGSILFPVDEIEGGYSEIITFDGLGGFTATIIADFDTYRRNEGALIVPSDLTGGPDPGAAADEYAMYAIYIADGTVTDQGGGVFTFTTNNVTATLYIDPLVDTDKSLPAVGGAAPTLLNTGDDYDLLTVTSVYFENNFVDLVNDVGVFDIRFDDPDLSSCAPATTTCGDAFFAFLSELNLRATIDGDFSSFDPSAAGNVLTTGDQSLVFQVVPEPVTLSLLGLGLLSSGLVARRRQRAQKI
jgi:hypothetical protein